MRGTTVQRSSHAAGFTLATLFCTTLSQYLSTRQSDLYSELLCWVTIPILFKVQRGLQSRSPDDIRPQVKHVERNYASPISLFSSHAWLKLSPMWAIALGITINTLYKTEFLIVELYPLLTPLLLAAKNAGASTSRLSSVPRPRPEGLATLHDTLSGAMGFGLFSIFALPTCDLQTVALSIIPIIAMLLLYASLTPTITETQFFHHSLNFEDAVLHISLRVLTGLLAVLGTQAIVFGLPAIQVLPTISVGLLKACAWYFTARSARFASWRIAPMIGTFSLMATRDPLSYSSASQALLYVLASLLAIAQIVSMLPKTAPYKAGLWVMASLPITTHFTSLFWSASAQRMAQDHDRLLHPHPVQTLVLNARTQFERLVSEQSQTFNEAGAEYRRRHGIEPPPGFQRWYDFAVSHKSPMIDHFDTIYDSVSPFWKRSGQDVSRLLKQAQDTAGSELWRCLLSSRSAGISCGHPYRSFDRHVSSMFNDLFKNVSATLPDVKFLVNHFDEPASLVSHQHSTYQGRQNDESLRMTHMSKSPSWGAITKFCADGKDSLSVEAEHPFRGFNLPFVKNITSAMDLCQHVEYGNLHGFFIRPTSFRLFEGSGPVLSTGAPSTMGDILFPSPAYSEDEFLYDERHDPDWEDKINKLYWAGSTTGGFAQDDQWRNFHRQRFVDLVQNPEKKRRYHYLDRRGKIVKHITSSFLNRRQYDVAFTKVVGCNRRRCRDQRTYFDVKSWTDKDRALQSRLDFDIDGNGISGRYYKLLASKSAPLKLTIFREWHDDRLVPWYHYIPVSLGMEELPELVMYLTSTESGRLVAESIAIQGRQWYSKALREVDKTIYLYRLLLELARLQDPAREAI